MNHHFFKKKWGQNFLRNNHIIEKIIDQIDNDSYVIEVGPGDGALTKRILSKVKKLVAIEIDSDLIEKLNNEIKDEKFKLINYDVMKIDFNSFINEHFQSAKKITLVSNLPYNISSQVLFKIYENYDLFDKAILMLQKEVADKLNANPSDENYSNITVATKTICSYQEIAFVGRNNFFPVPNVDSKVFKLTFNKNLDGIDLNKFLNYLKKIFLHRRKTLKNNLKNFHINDEKIDILLNIKKLNKTIRPEELNEKNHLSLFFLLNDFNLIKSNAKITLALSVGKKINDYHEILGIYYPIFNLYDEIFIKESNINKVNFYPSQIYNSSIDKILKKNLTEKKYEIFVIKNIPLGSGMAGGSSNAWFFLDYINNKNSLNLSKNEIENILKPISTDSLFFINNSLSLVSGNGEIIEEIDTKLKLDIELFFSEIDSSTKKVYEEFDRITNDPKINNDKINLIVNSLKNNDLKNVKNHLFNDLSLAFKNLYNLNINWKDKKLTGSGSTLFVVK
ncbi:MAG: 16S rRNA (adenine(1518)-N(6)/adenine(1519)-N(6))-dimethyltransferase RsmA [Mycoplasma sp.]